EHAKAAIASGEKGACFAAALLMIELREFRGLASVLDASADDPEAQADVAGALAWAELEDAWEMIEPLMQPHQPPPLLAIALTTAVAHRRDPGPLLGYAAESDDARLRALGLRSIGVLGRRDLAELLPRSFHHPDAAVRFAAAWSAARIGVGGAVET